MGTIRRSWAIKVCRECGSNVHTDECRYAGPLTNAPGDEVEVVPASDLRGAVDALRDAWGYLAYDEPNAAQVVIERACEVLGVDPAIHPRGQSSPADCPACSRVPGVARPPHTCSGEQS